MVMAIEIFTSIHTIDEGMRNINLLSCCGSLKRRPDRKLRLSKDD